jgi:hypothetical protein
MDFDSKIVISPRSVLLRPEPKGKGTAQLESLSSYLSGVAKLHGHSLGQLIWHHVPEIRSSGKDRHGRPLWCLRSDWAFNTHRLVRTFSQLTLRGDLAHLTFAAWEKVISARGFFSHYQKWCWQCLAEDCYERLAWTTEPGQCCAVHGTKLRQTCTSCHRPAYRKNTRSPWLQCPFCGSDRRDDKSAFAATKEEIWTARQISNLVRVGQQGIDPENKRAYEIWHKLIRPHFSTHREAARFLGLHTSPGKTLVGPRESLRFSLQLLLQICACLRLNLDDLLLEDVTALKPRFRRADNIFGGTRLTRDEIVQRITVALRDPDNRPFNLAGLMRKVGVHKLTLRSRAPEIYNEVVSYFKRRRKEEFSQVKKERLARAVKFLREHGQNVSKSAVARAVGVSHSYHEFLPEARRIAFPEPK